MTQRHSHLRIRASRTTIIVTVLALTAWMQAADQQPVGWSGVALDRWETPVATAAIVTDGVTDIRWLPVPYVPTPGSSVRYIDYAGGDDTRDGTSPATAWRHHPWDPAATNNPAAASGPRTYFFKGGVVYRGTLVADESGTGDQPIRLLADPAWGAGPAVIAGSVALSGWQRVDPATTDAGFTAAAVQHLWMAQVPGTAIPRAAWQVQPDGTRTRLVLARWPNWRVEHPYDHFTQWFRIESFKHAFPRMTISAPKVLTGFAPDAFKGATIWADHPNQSGEFSIYGPFPSSVGAYDAKTGSLRPQLNHPARHPRTGSPFYLENLPRFLDEPGEWYFAATSRRCYLWLPEGSDPNATTIEVAQHEIILDIHGQGHIEVGGLTFTGGNVGDLNDAPETRDHTAPERSAVMCAIRLRGDCHDLDLHHLRVGDTAGSGISNLITDRSDVVRGISIRDSVFERIDNDAIHLYRGFGSRRSEAQPKGRLTDIQIWRNRFHTIGLRCSQAQGGQAIDLFGVEVCDIAGNVTHTTGGQGINVVGGRPLGAWISEDAADSPLVRIQIRNNKVEDSLLYRTDFGGIEFWGSGPAYISNNISANPIGFVAHRKVYHKNEAIYLDHGIKAYVFNNIGWSERRADAYKGVVGDCFLNEIRTRWNQLFHNTGYAFRKGQSHASHHGDQQHYLANLFVDCHFGGTSHWRLDQAAEIAYANNLFAGKTAAVYDRWRGETFITPEQYHTFAGGLKNLLSDQIGWVTDDQPLRDPERRDFRPSDTSAAIDRGVRVFVPWSLSGCVGEWHFRKHAADPTTVLAYDLYPQKVYRNATPHLDGPIALNHLAAPDHTLADYIRGPLEDWVDGAIRLDGKRVLTLADAVLVSDLKHEVKDGEPIVIPGRERQTVRMETNNFLIEAVLTVTSDGLIAGKRDQVAGYALVVVDGRPAVELTSAGRSVVQAARTRIDDGRWHHLLAEVDRRTGRITIHVDGVDVTAQASGAPLPAEASLDNHADFVVGSGLVGALDYLRVCRGTLADADTTMAELMRWQFNGPHLHDFAGRPPTGGVRDVGALEHATVAGRQPITYTPPTSTAREVEDEAAADVVAFKAGPDRTVKAFEWGSVSVPKQIAPGQQIDVQVVFGTETIAKPLILRVDLHGFQGRKALSAIAHSGDVAVKPGVTTPYVAKVTVPKREGLTAVSALFYVSLDGGWKSKTISGSLTIPVGSDE